MESNETFRNASLFAMFGPQGACPTKDIAAKTSSHLIDR